MRKNIVLPVLFLAALIISLTVTFSIAGTYRQNGLLFGGSTSDFSTGWKTGDGEAVSVPGNVGSRLKTSVVLANVLPPDLEDGSVLYLKTSYQSLDVTLNGEIIYSWERQLNTPSAKPFALPYYLVRLPASSAGMPLELHMTPSGRAEGVTVYSISVGDGVSTMIKLISENLTTAFLCAVMAVLFIFIVACVILFRKRISLPNRSGALCLAAFVALSAVWVLSDSDLHLIFTPNVTATHYCAVLSLMLMPVPLLLFLRRLTQIGDRVLYILSALILLNFFVCLSLVSAGVSDLVQLLVTSNILELVSCVALLILCLVELLRFKRREMLEAFIGLVLLCLFAAASVVAFSISGNPRSTIFSHAGLTLFVLALGYGLARRGVAELARSKSYVELTMSIPSGICRIENFDTGRIIFANEFYYKMFGYSEAEARGAGFDTAYFTVLPEDLAAMKDKIKKNFAVSLNRFETETRHVGKDGEIIWILARYRMEQNSFGAITLVMIDITDRKQMEEKLRISEEEYRIATLHSNKLIVRLDIQTRTAYCQSGAPSIFGVSPVMENIPESILATGIIAPDGADAFRSFFDAIYRGDREGNAVVSVYERNSGEYRWYHYDFTTIFSDGGTPVQAIITFYDVTLQRQKELAFQRWQQSYNAIPKNATNYYEYNLTDDRIEHEEGGMIPPIPGEVPRTLKEFAAFIAERHIYLEDMDAWQAFMSRDLLLERYSADQHSQKMEFRRLTGGEAKWTSVSVQLIPDPYSSDVKCYFLLEDIDERKKAELHLQERSTRDSLTGLLNRATFVEQFNEILLRSGLETQHALIMLDIDNFKMINDTFGHGAGDALLMNVANKLKYALRSDDLCGRLGGDEFVICLRSMNYGKPLETRVNDLCSMICDDNNGVTVSASFGIACFPSDGLTFEELYKKADIALYKAKAQGRGCYAVYDPQLSFDDMSVPLNQA